MTKYFFGMYWSIGFRSGCGLDIEAASTRPVWCIDGDETFAVAFNGLVILLPLVMFTVGNLVESGE
jgi:hypothetical protein